MVFDTERLLLRPFTPKDAPLVRAISEDPETTRYLFYWGRMGSTPEADAERYLHYAVSSPFEYCLVKKDTGVAIGSGSLEKLDDKTAEIGWILLPAYRHHGYAHEMAQRLLRCAFLEMGVQTVIAHCDARNAPSQQVMKRLNMRFTQCRAEARPEKTPGEKRGDEYTFAITKAEWLKNQRKE